MEGWDPGEVTKKSKLHALMRLIRIEHTLFSLPFAYVGAFLSDYGFTLRDAILIAAALFGLRSAAMAYNNIADLHIDSKNPRSRNRPLVQGIISVREAYIVVLAGSLLYYISAALLNRYALMLSPILWIVAITYPYAKRVHPVPHIHLGLVLGLSVLGGSVAASGDELNSLASVLRTVPWDYVLAVTLWVAGFDTIYSIMDVEFDQKHGLGSIPSWLGEKRAVKIALAMHIIASALLVYGVLSRGLGHFSLIGVTAGAALMIYSDIIAFQKEKIPRAFNINLYVGLLVSIGILIDYLSPTANLSLIPSPTKAPSTVSILTYTRPRRPSQ